ncbi:MAG: hypothetical protein KJ955_07735 [Nanoarchaeota archaeon]|nr:hypothetical protein [Nanoarchaeota archaeon]
MIRKIITISIIILLLFTIAGCAAKEDIKSEEEAQEAVVDVSGDISDISDTLEDIEKDLT